MAVHSSQILVVGAGGQLGNALVTELNFQMGGGIQYYVAKTRDALDVTNFCKIKKQLELLKPDVVINVAGCTDWRAAASTASREKIWATTVQGADNLAKLCAFLNILLLHVGCHDVFGMGSHAATHLYTETDPLAPANFLGSAHAYAEHAVLRLESSHLIVRCGPLFSPPTATRWQCDLLQQVTNPRRTSACPGHMLASDLYITPAYTPHVAKVLIWLARNGRSVPTGIYHVANRGITTPYDFASFCRQRIEWSGQAVLEPTSLDEISQRLGDKPCEVNRSTCLSTEKLHSYTPVEMPTWHDAVEEFSSSLSCWA